MQKEITATNFGEIIELQGRGTASKYVSKGLIVLYKGSKFVDVEKTIHALRKGRPNHQLSAQKAIDFFYGEAKAQQEIIRANPTGKLTEHHDIDPPIEAGKSSLMEAMRDKYLIEIKLKQVQLNEKIGKLIDKETVLRIFENILIQIKKDLLNMSRSKIDAVLREKDNPQSAEKILYDSIHDILHKNSRNNI